MSRTRSVAFLFALALSATASAQENTSPPGDPAPPVDPTAPAPGQPTPGDPTPPAPGEPMSPGEPAAPPATPPVTTAPLGSAPVLRDTEEGDLPIPTMHIDRVLPRFSYELAVQIGYGDVGYFRQTIGQWVSFGIRSAWGRNIGPHRIGVEGIVGLDGPFGTHTTIFAEPRLAWDFISGVDKGVQLGGSLGPSLAYRNVAVVGPENNLIAYTVSPTAAFRVGYSEGWSREGRRFFAFVEPRVRYELVGEAVDQGQPFSPGISIAVGSGRGY